MSLAHAYRFGAYLTRLAPARARYGIAAGAAAAFYQFNPLRRGPARSNYAAVMRTSPSDPAVRRMVRHAAANYGRMLADFLFLGSLPPDEVRQMLSHDGKEHVDAALAGGRGAILALPHMGSWDLCGSLAGLFGYQIVAVAEPMPGSLNREIVATRSRHGLQIVMLGRSAVRELSRALASNHLVALLCDLPHGAGVSVRMFGTTVTVPAGPGALACRHLCPILPVYSRRTAPGRYHVHIDPPILPPDAPAGRDGSAEMMQRVADRFQAFIARHPDQWYAFRPFMTGSSSPPGH